MAGISEVNTDKLVFAFAERVPSTLYGPDAAKNKEASTAQATDVAKQYINNIIVNQLGSNLGSIRVDVH